MSINNLCSFHPSAQAIEGDAIGLIDHSFKTLRSSTAAFKMLLKFKHICFRKAINDHLMKKFNDILVQFCKEVPYATVTDTVCICIVLS